MGPVERVIAKGKRAKPAQQTKPAAPSSGNGQSAAATRIVRASPGSEHPQIDFSTLRTVKLNPAILNANRVIAGTDAPASMSYKMLRTRVLQRMRANGWTTLAVTGTCPDEGKTLTAINLSLSMARDVNASVVLVDFDLRQPSIYRTLGLSPQYGLNDCLERDVPLDQALVRPVGHKRLSLLLNQKSYVDSSEQLSSPKMLHMMNQLRAGPGRIVVFDMPPILATDDMLAFSPVVDAILLVVSQGTTKQEDLVAARQLMEEANVLGTVLNRSTEDQSPYYYGYGKY